MSREAEKGAGGERGLTVWDRALSLPRRSQGAARFFALAHAGPKVSVSLSGL